MKHHSLCFATALFLACTMLPSCSGDDEKIDGAWVGGEERIFLSEKSIADCQAVSRFTFTPDADNNRKGTVTIVSDITIQDAVAPTDTSYFPDSNYEVSVVGEAMISGNYTFERDEDDDIIISLDPKSLKTSVNPDAVVYAANIVTGQQDPQVEPVPRQELAVRYERQLRAAVSALYEKYHKISDIKITHNIMSCEINDRDYSFRRIDPQSKQ